MPHKDPEARREYIRRYYAEGRGRKRVVADLTPEEHEKVKKAARERNAKYTRAWYARNGGQGYRSRGWEYKLKRKFGLSVDDFDKMMADQGKKCAACGNPFAKGAGSRSDRLAVDHCHITGRVRGILCGACNRTIGHAQENVKRLIACADYLLNCL